jgi:hypothetical protein
VTDSIYYDFGMRPTGTTKLRQLEKRLTVGFVGTSVASTANDGLK